MHALGKVFFSGGGVGGRMYWGVWEGYLWDAGICTWLLTVEVGRAVSFPVTVSGRLVQTWDAATAVWPSCQRLSAGSLGLSGQDLAAARDQSDVDAGGGGSNREADRISELQGLLQKNPGHCLLFEKSSCTEDQKRSNDRGKPWMRFAAKLQVASMQVSCASGDELVHCCPW